MGRAEASVETLRRGQPCVYLACLEAEVGVVAMEVVYTQHARPKFELLEENDGICYEQTDRGAFFLTGT